MQPNNNIALNNIWHHIFLVFILCDYLDHSTWVVFYSLRVLI